MSSMSRRKRKTYASQGLIHSERKLFKIGQSLAVTVPKEWVVLHGLKPGDSLSQLGNSILSMGPTAIPHSEK